MPNLMFRLGHHREAWPARFCGLGLATPSSAHKQLRTCGEETGLKAVSQPTGTFLCALESDGNGAVVR